MAQNSGLNQGKPYLARVINLALCYWGGEQVFYVDGVKGNQKVVVLQIGDTTLKHISEDDIIVELSLFGEGKEEIIRMIEAEDTSYRTATESKAIYKGPDVGIYTHENLRELVKRLDGEEIILDSVYQAKGTAIRRMLNKFKLGQLLEVEVYGIPDCISEMERIIKGEEIMWRRDRLAEEDDGGVARSA